MAFASLLWWHAAALEAKSELQTFVTSAVDAARYSVVREAKYAQQNAVELAGSSTGFAATTSSATQYQVTNRRQSNARAQRRSRDTRETSKADYLYGFDVSIHGPLHAQTFVAKHMQLFHSELLQYISSIAFTVQNCGL